MSKRSSNNTEGDMDLRTGYESISIGGKDYSCGDIIYIKNKIYYLANICQSKKLGYFILFIPFV